MRPRTLDCTYWDSVIAKTDVDSSDDIQASGIFVAVGFDMWLVWSSIIIELNYGDNIEHRDDANIGDNNDSTTHNTYYNRDGLLAKISIITSIPDYRSTTVQDTSSCSCLVSSHPLRERHPNPWFDIVNFVPTRYESDTQHRRFPFAYLPTELRQHIARLLPKETAFALALTSRAMYNLVPPQFYKTLSILERWRLLLLLERDSDLLVACQQCIKLHSPFDIPCEGKWKSLLPAGITPALCRLLAKRYIRQERYTDLLSIARRTEIYTDQEFKVFTNTALRMVDGSLFVRLETSIAPLTFEGNLTSHSAYLLNSMLHNSNGRACPHIRWQHLGLGLSCSSRSDLDQYSSLSASYLGSQLSNKNYLRDQLLGKDPLKDRLYKLDHKRQDSFLMNDQYAFCTNPRCLAEESIWLGHTADCYDSAPVPPTILDNALGPGIDCALFHAQPCRKPECQRLPARFRVNLVRACEICATDLCISAQDVEGVGRIITLTTWKNLGGVYDGQWVNWYPHSTEVGRVTRDLIVGGQRQMTRSLNEGAAVYARFENLPITGEIAWYTPPIDSRMLDAFKGERTVWDKDWFTGPSLLNLNVV